MIIIGITGGIGHGKSALAEAFAKAEPRTIRLESFEVVAEVINAWQAHTKTLPSPHDLAAVNAWLELLPAALRQVVHLNVTADATRCAAADIAAHPELYQKLFAYLEVAQRDRSLQSTPISTDNKTRYRAILQWLGGWGVLKIAPGIWYDELLRRAEAASKRGTQLAVIGGVRFVSDAAIVRAGGYIVRIFRPLISESDIDDPTERERSRIQPDITLVNDAGLAHLAACAQHMYDDIKLGKLQTQYIASDTSTPAISAPDLYNLAPDSS